MGEARALGRLLVACTMSDGEPVPSELVDDARGSLQHVAEAASHHGISMAVHLGLVDADIPESLREQLRSIYEFWKMHHLVMILELARLAKVLDGAGVRWLTLKGPVLSERLYRRNDLRSYADLDVLVERADFTTAVEAIENLGGSGLETDWELVLHELKGELNFALSTRVVVDLHWSLLYDSTLRSQFAFSDGAALERRVRAHLLPRIDVPTLDPVDTFLHLALHACLAGGQKLSWMRDLSLAGAIPAMDFDEVVRRAHQQRIGLPVGVMLGKVRRALGVVPWDQRLEASMCGRGRWPDVVAGLDRVRPPERWHGGSLTGHLLCGATRANSRESVRQLVGRVKTEVGVFRTDSGHPWRRRFPSTTELIALPAPQPHGGSSAFREAYLAAVGRVRGR